MNRRRDVETIITQPTTHPGLWLDKYLPDDKDGTKQALVERVSCLSEETKPNNTSALPYVEFFNRWQSALEQAGVPKGQMRSASVQGRLSVGLGGEAVLETAITLHRTYGVPYIPGSALKGLAASYAHKHLQDNEWRKGHGAHSIMFGSPQSAGYLTFFDALYIPGSAFQGRSLWSDVITVHHPHYYQGKEPPADWDSPIPVPFLSATGSYLIAIGGDTIWANKAFQILSLALLEEGIGAKTSSGYGRMHLDMTPDVASGSEPSLDRGAHLSPADHPLVKDFKLRLDQMPHARVPSEIHAVYQQWKSLDTTEEIKQLIAQAVLDKNQAAGRAKASKDKGWYQELMSCVQK